MSFLDIMNGTQDPNDETSLRRELIKFDEKYKYYKEQYISVKSTYKEWLASVNGNTDQFTDEQMVRFEKLGDALSDLIELLEQEEDERNSVIAVWHDLHDDE